MNYEQQIIATMVSLNNQMNEIAAMYAITSEMQDSVKKLIESNKVTHVNIASEYTKFNSIAFQKIEAVMKKELKNVGDMITESTLIKCENSVNEAADKIRLGTKQLAKSTEIFNEASKRLSFKVWISICTALFLSIFIFGVIGKIWLSHLIEKINVNKSLLLEQEKNISILTRRGVEVFVNHQGVFVITQKGLAAAECGKTPCYFIK